MEADKRFRQKTNTTCKLKTTVHTTPQTDTENIFLLIFQGQTALLTINLCVRGSSVIGRGRKGWSKYRMFPFCLSQYVNQGHLNCMHASHK